MECCRSWQVAGYKRALMVLFVKTILVVAFTSAMNVLYWYFFEDTKYPRCFQFYKSPGCGILFAFIILGLIFATEPCFSCFGGARPNVEGLSLEEHMKEMDEFDARNRTRTRGRWQCADAEPGMSTDAITFASENLMTDESSQPGLHDAWMFLQGDRKIVKKEQPDTHSKLKVVAQVHVSAPEVSVEVIDEDAAKNSAKESSEPPLANSTGVDCDLSLDPDNTRLAWLGHYNYGKNVLNNNSEKSFRHGYGAFKMSDINTAAYKTMLPGLVSEIQTRQFKRNLKYFESFHDEHKRRTRRNKKLALRSEDKYSSDSGDSEIKVKRKRLASKYRYNKNSKCSCERPRGRQIDLFRFETMKCIESSDVDGYSSTISTSSSSSLMSDGEFSEIILQEQEVSKLN